MLKITRSVTNILLMGAVAVYVPAAFGQSIFTAVPIPNENFDNGLLAISADSPTDIWAVGQSAIHYDGTQWTAFPVPMIDGNNTSSLGGVVAISPTEAWAVGLLNSSGNVPPNQVIERWDGTQWNLYPNPTFPANAEPNLYTMTAVSANDIWAVGSLLQSAETLYFLFEHWDGTSWTFSRIQTDNGFLMGSSADATNDVWAVGYSGDLAESSDTLVYHYNGTAWEKMASPKAGAADQLSAVAALAPNDVWAVGNYYQALHDPQLTLIEHYDGSSWAVVPSPNVGPNSNFQSNRLFGITALSPTDIWAFGSYFAASGSGHQMTLLLHWDGTAWSIAPSPNPSKDGFLSDVLFAGVSPAAGELWIVGSEDEAPHTGTLAIRSTTAGTN
jgi:hypothetical protein